MTASKRFLTMLPVLAALECVASAQPTISAVLNAASYSAVVAPGCWVAVFGTNLATVSLSAQTVPLPVTLGGVSVTVAGRPAPMRYVSAGQINVLIPVEVEIPANTVVPLVVTSPAGNSSYNIRLTRNAPGIFTGNGPDTGRALAFDLNFQPVNTIAAQDNVIFYATGLGPTDNSGRVIDNVDVYIGERRAQVNFAGLAPGFPGIYQLNVSAPVPATDRVYLRTGGWQSNIAEVGIRSGANTTNVAGSIDGLHPSSDRFFTLPECPPSEDQFYECFMGQAFSIMLHAGSFRVSFDVVSSARPFDIAAVGEGGGSIITIDPAAGTYTASVTTVTSEVKRQDWSRFVPPVSFYGDCNRSSAVCGPPRGIPPPITDAFWLTARLLPAATITTPTSPNGILQVSGGLSGSRFVVDGQNNTALSTFGGFVQLQYGPFAKGVSMFKLYVDGRLVSAKAYEYSLHHRD
jgi:uncharacterized protein (TIGR03437 family)